MDKFVVYIMNTKVNNLGSGAQGSVYLINHQGKKYAAKTFKKKNDLLSDFIIAGEFQNEYTKNVIKKYREKSAKDQIQMFSKRIKEIADEINNTVKTDLPIICRPTDTNIDDIFCISPILSENVLSSLSHKFNILYDYVAQNNYDECSSFLTYFTFCFNMTCAHKHGHTHKDVHDGNFICHNKYIYLIDLDFMIWSRRGKYRFSEYIEFIYCLQLLKSKCPDSMDSEFKDIFFYLLFYNFIMSFLYERNDASLPKVYDLDLIFKIERKILYRLLDYCENNHILSKINLDPVDKQKITAFKNVLEPYKDVDELMNKCLKNYLSLSVRGQKYINIKDPSVELIAESDERWSGFFITRISFIIPNKSTTYTSFLTKEQQEKFSKIVKNIFNSSAEKLINDLTRQKKVDIPKIIFFKILFKLSQNKDIKYNLQVGNNNFIFKQSFDDFSKLI